MIRSAIIHLHWVWVLSEKNCRGYAATPAQGMVLSEQKLQAIDYIRLVQWIGLVTQSCDTNIDKNIKFLHPDGPC